MAVNVNELLTPQELTQLRNLLGFVKEKSVPEILTVKQVAGLIGWHTNTVYKRCVSGELRSFKCGRSRRIRREAFFEWITRLENLG